MNEIESRYIKMSMTREEESRAVMSDDIDSILMQIFPNDPDFVAKNRHVSNELLRGVGELIDGISAARLNWTSGSKSDDELIGALFRPQLVRTLAIDALVTGKLALYPNIEGASVTMIVPAGYLHPIYAIGNAFETEAVLQILPIKTEQGPVYEVRKYSAGLLEIYPPVQEWKAYDQGTPEVLKHRGDGLPMAFAIARRNAQRMPAGIVGEALPAYKRYLKTAVNANAVQEIAGWPERVVRSDKYLQLLLGEIPAPQGQTRESIIAELKKVAPRQLKLLGTGDTYEVQDGIDPSPYLEAEQQHKQAMLDMLRVPSLEGGNLTGIVIAERQNKTRTLIAELCNALADLMTEAARIASLSVAGIPDDIVVSLEPQYPTVRAAKVAEVSDLYSKGILPRSAALLELQTAGYTSITDAMIDAAKALEEAEVTI